MRATYEKKGSYSVRGLKGEGHSVRGPVQIKGCSESPGGVHACIQAQPTKLAPSRLVLSM